MKASERILDAMIGFLPWVAGVCVVAGIVHIVSILAMPRLAPADAYSQMSEIAPLNRITLLPAASPEARSAPFADPMVAQGVCRFDLAEGPVRLRATLDPDALMLFSFHARYGQIFYSMTDRSATRGKLDLLLLTPQQLEAVEATDSEDELPQELRIVAPTREGFLLFRSLAERPVEFANAQRRISAISCGRDRDARS